MAPSLKLVTVWLLIGTAVFLAVQALQQRSERARFAFDDASGRIELTRSRDGHFHWPGRVNGVAVDFLVDTGATGTAIPAALARELRLESEGKTRASTAGGAVVGDIARADLVLQGGVRVDRLRIVALPGLSGNPLLGMDVLGRLHWQQQAGVLRIDLRPGTGASR
jgi:aspartyl protease family protein